MGTTEETQERVVEIGEGIWKKFHSLFGHVHGFEVGLKTIVPRVSGSLAGLASQYAEAGLVYDNPREPIQLVYEPAVYLSDSCVVFEAPQWPPEYRRKIEFRRKRVRESGAPRFWAVAARHGEINDLGEPYHFGFSSPNSRKQFHLPLAYPGITGEFVPVYFKIETQLGQYQYFLVQANPAGEQGEYLAVQGAEVSVEEAPFALWDAFRF